MLHSLPISCMSKEEYYEADILEYLTLHGVSCEKIVTEGFYDANHGFYRPRKSNYIRNGSSDVHATIPPYWRALYIEVKKPEEMSFFDRPLAELTERKIQSSAKSKTKYQRAIDQRAYLDEKIRMWAVAFFASTPKEVEERLIEQGINIF